MDIHAWQHGAMNRSNKTAAIMVKDECVVADAGRVAIVIYCVCVCYTVTVCRVGGSSCVRQFLALSRHFEQRRPKQILLPAVGAKQNFPHKLLPTLQ